MSETPYTLKDHYKELAAIVGQAVSEALEENRAKALEARAAPPVTPPVDTSKEFDKQNAVGRLVKYLACSGNDAFRARDLAHKLGDKMVADGIVGKAMAEGQLSTGGALIDGNFATDIIETLRAEAVVRAAGVRTVPMPAGVMQMPFGDTGSTASYTGEVTAQNENSASVGQLELSAKKLRVTSAISNDLLRDTSGRADAFIRGDVVGAIAEREDLAFLYNDGTAGTPRGMFYWATAAGNTSPQLGTTLANITDSLGVAVQTPLDDNVRLRNPHWFISPRTWRALITARTTDGHLVWQPEMAMGMLMGYPFSRSTQIVNNLGGGSNESYVIFGDMDGCVIGETTQMEIGVFEAAAYADANGTVQAGLSRDETVVRAITRHDFGARYRGKEFGVITGVTWGA